VKTPISITIEENLLKQIDEFRNKRNPSLDRSSAITEMCINFLKIFPTITDSYQKLKSRIEVLERRVLND